MLNSGKNKQNNLTLYLGFLAITIFIGISIFTTVIASNNELSPVSESAHQNLLPPRLIHIREFGAAKLPPSAVRIGVTDLVMEENGFSQSEVTISAGKQLFIIRNLTRRDTKFLLRNSTGQVLKMINVDQAPFVWKDVLSLPSGTYELAAVNMPIFKCSITVN